MNAQYQTVLGLGCPDCGGGCDHQAPGLGETNNTIPKALLIGGGALAAAGIYFTLFHNYDKPKKGLKGTDSYAKEVGKLVLPKIAIWGVGIGAGYFLVIKPILESVGVIQTNADKKRDQAADEYGTSATSPFNPTWWKTIPGASLITKAATEAMAETIYGAIGNFYDDENAVYSVFRKLKAKTQVSWLADIFAQRYDADLYQYLRRNLSDSEMDIIHGIVNNMALK